MFVDVRNREDIILGSHSLQSSEHPMELVGLELPLFATGTTFRGAEQEESSGPAWPLSHNLHYQPRHFKLGLQVGRVTP